MNHIAKVVAIFSTFTVDTYHQWQYRIAGMDYYCFRERALKNVQFCSSSRKATNF